MSKTWRHDPEENTHWMAFDIVDNGHFDGPLEVEPIAAVRVTVGGKQLMFAPHEARRFAKVLRKAAKRIENGKGYAR